MKNTLEKTDKPCPDPECGGEGVLHFIPASMRAVNQNVAYAHCTVCGLTGREAQTKKMAHKYWNEMTDEEMVAARDRAAEEERKLAI